MIEALLVVLAGLFGGGVAAIAGFGIGSVLTPLFGLRLDTPLAVAAVGIPHAIGTALRLGMLRRHVDWRVVRGFGALSAAGGLVGALLQSAFSGRLLTVVFGALLLLTAISELTGWMSRVAWGRRAAAIAGAVSGVLGGLAGNQGSIRSAAMLGFRVPKESFVATATAVGLCVDLARVPVYVVMRGEQLAGLVPELALATAGVVVGTIVGLGLLRRIPAPAFRRVVAVLLIALGVTMIVTGARTASPRG